ncbi:MAG: NAD(P)/FAD-dependent oxidoreductase [Betaproteobacteria bacterium]|nr:NAD(P)/FAD-dependent oxidoreductase [Betaproteobacteria bacterium]
MHNMYPPHQVFDAVVFGSGLAGLSFARRLAVKGKKVLLLEKSKSLGGHLLPFERAGAVFEVGIHYIADTARGSHFASALERLNIELEPIALDDQFEVLRFEKGGASADEEISYCRPMSQFSEELERLYPEQALSIKKYFEALEIVWQFMRTVDFPLTTKKTLRAFFKSNHKLRLGKLAFQTLGQFLDELGIHGKLREILAVHHVLIGVPPSRVSAVLHMVVQRYYFENACFVRGGGRAMIDALLHPAVEYKTNCPAEIERAHDTTLAGEGVRYVVKAQSGEKYLARNVVWTPDPRLLEEVAEGFSLSAFLREKLRRVETPHALVVGYFATQKALEDYGLKNCNYWLMGTLDSEQCYLEQDLELLAAGAPVYMSTGSLRDPEAIKPDNKIGAHGVFQAMFLCPPTSDIWGGDDLDTYRVPESRGGYGRGYRLKKEQILKTLTQRIVRCWPALEGELVWCELGTPLTHRRYLNSVTLNGYGFAPTVSDLLWKRPGTSTGEEGLYFCGAHVRPAHGIVTALLNGVGLADSMGT